MNKIFRYLMSLVAVSFLLASCSDWNDVKSLDFEPNKVEENNPELYQKYLKDLRDYKQTEHKVVYAWFDNSSKQPRSRAEHMVTLPDSIDYIVLQHPNNLANWEVKELNEVREKGTKTLLEFDFDVAKYQYDEIIAEMLNEGKDISNMPTFMDVLVDTVDQTFKVISKYNYDGLVIGYKGKRILHMTEDEKVEFLAYQNAFIRVTSVWKENNQSKTIAFMGKPENVIDKSVLASYQHIIIPTQSSANLSEVIYAITMSLSDDVPRDRFIVTAQTVSLDKDDAKTGLWTDGQKAVSGVANWASSTHNDFTVAGIGIYDAGRDYYNPAFIFPATRNAIQTLNPSLKNK